MFLIDYLSFTINKPCITFEDVTEILGLSSLNHEFVDMGGLRRYAHCFKLNNINISTPHNHLKEMGIYVDMSGQGCREYESYFSNLEFAYDWSTLFKKMIWLVNQGYKVNITRIDLAFDDFDGILKLSTVLRKLKRGEYVSKFKKWREITQENVYSKSDSLGKTIYLGSRQSSCFCRFYDKLAEQKSKNKSNEPMQEKLNSMKHWTRFEIVFKDELGITVSNMIASSCNLDEDITAYINSCVRFVDMKCTRAENCPMSKWWIDFIQSSNIKRVKKVLSNIKGWNPSYAWWAKSVAPTAYALMQSYKDVDTFIKDIVEYGSTRQKSRHNLITNGVTTGNKMNNADLWHYNNPCRGQNPYSKDMNMYKPFKY